MSEIKGVITGGSLSGKINGEKALNASLRVGLTNYHNLTLNRDLPDQHPIGAITGLEGELLNRFEDAWVEDGYLILKRGDDQLRLGPFAGEDDPYIVRMKTERGTLVRGKYNNNLAYKDNCRRTTHLLSVVPGAQIKISGDWTAEPTITIFKYDANGEFVSGVTTYDTVYTVPSDAAFIKPHMRWDADVDGEYTLTVISNKPIATAMNPRLGSAEEDPSVGVSSESFYFETEPGIWTTARLVLPPNYTIEGAPVPLLVYAHGGSDFVNKIINGEITAHAWDRPAFHNYETAAKYFRAEGFALLDVYGWTTKYQPEWDNLTSSSWPIPTTIKAYKSGIKWVLDRWNLDANAVHLWCKSLGGELSRVFANDPDVDFKTISMLAPALDMLSTGSFGYKKDNAAIIASEFGMANAANYLTTNYGTTRSAAGRAFFEANKYAFSNFNPGWFFDDVPVSEKLRASMGKSYIYSGKAAHSRCPVKIWVAQDDAIIPFEKCAEYAAQLKIGGCKVYFRVWPNNAGGHKMSMDDVAGAPYRHDYVTALGIKVEDVGEEYHEIVEFIRGNRYGEMFDRSVNAACEAFPIATATGATVQITDGADHVPLKELSVDLPYTGTKYTSVTLTRANSDSSDVETLTIPLDESYDVYGGSLDVVHGVLTSTKAAGGTDLGSPVTYQLLPSNLHTVLGENNFSTDAGDLSLTYRADPTMYGNHAAPSAGEFYATYGVTTSAEIEAALQDGKICACVYSDRIYYLGYRGSATAHGFYCAIDGTSQTTIYRVYCSNGAWSNSSHSVLRKPLSASSGNVLKYDGSDWTAAALTASDVGAYEKPSGGIPKTDLASAVQTSLGKADSAYQKPSGGIPASDIAAGVIPDDKIFYCTYGTTTSAQIETAYQAGKIVACKYSDRVYYLGYRASATGHGFYCTIDGTSLTTVYRIYCNNGTWTNSSHSAIRKPSSPTTGNVLKYNGSDWVAAALSASDVGAVAVAQGSGNAGKFLVVGSDGNVTTVSMTTWQGGNY